MEAAIIATYRCPMKCVMCNIWKHPTTADEEFKPDLLRKLPRLKLVNLTGGEPAIREDLESIVDILFTKTSRVVISTSGWFEERTLALAQKYPKLGFRVSIEGLSQKNDELRGRQGGFDRGLRVLLGLKRMGIKDIGFGITVSNNNSSDMLALYELAKELNLQFATAAFHNSFYFHKDDNAITNKDEVISNFEDLCNRLLAERHPKSWFRAYFNMGLINYIRGNGRLLPCEAGSASFFIDPWGNVLPCNGMEKKCWYGIMGNLKEAADFMEIWNSRQAEEIRKKVRNCPKNCWMIGSVSPVMKRHMRKVAMWVIKNKIRRAFGQKILSDYMPARIGSAGPPNAE
ncbi:MAG TPA: radical SAM protein [Acidobacteriota bacterium]|nr:radical SAM protein [Acidobacteriota bacterium]